MCPRKNMFGNQAAADGTKLDLDIGFQLVMDFVLVSLERFGFKKNAHISARQRGRLWPYLLGVSCDPTSVWRVGSQLTL